LLEPLGHTTQYANHEIGLPALVAVEYFKPLPNSLLGIIPDGAGIDQDEAGFLG